MLLFDASTNACVCRQDDGAAAAEAELHEGSTAPLEAAPANGTASPEAERQSPAETDKAPLKEADDLEATIDAAEATPLDVMEQQQEQTAASPPVLQEAPPLAAEQIATSPGHASINPGDAAEPSEAVEGAGIRCGLPAVNLKLCVDKSMKQWW